MTHIFHILNTQLTCLSITVNIHNVAVTKEKHEDKAIRIWAFQGKRTECCLVKTLLLTHNKNPFQTSWSGKKEIRQNGTLITHTQAPTEPGFSYHWKEHVRPVSNTGHHLSPSWLISKEHLSLHTSAPALLPLFPAVPTQNGHQSSGVYVFCSLHNIPATVKSKFLESYIDYAQFCSHNCMWSKELTSQRPSME